MTGGVEESGILSHGLGQTRTLYRVLQSPFFVTIAPEDDAGVVAVAFDHPLQESEMFVVDAHQSVLVDDQDTFAVADVE